MQNSHVEHYEELLTLGEYLPEDKIYALYLYLQEKNKEKFIGLEKDLLARGYANDQIANGQIQFVLTNNHVKNLVKENGTDEFRDGHREIRLSPFSNWNRRRLNKFFAQCETDAIWNFPLPGLNQRTDFGYGIHAYPFYDLNHYSNGKGKLRGLIKKIIFKKTGKLSF